MKGAHFTKHKTIYSLGCLLKKNEEGERDVQTHDRIVNITYIIHNISFYCLKYSNSIVKEEAFGSSWPSLAL
ncbi:hypothetical protein AtNW77_Chr1g0046701 [Arabidopsis thaliana]